MTHVILDTTLDFSSESKNNLSKHYLPPDETLFFDSLDHRNKQYYEMNGKSYIDLTHLAFCHHYGFTLNVAHIQSLLYCGISSIVNKFPEKLRFLFSDSKEKGKIEIDITHLSILRSFPISPEICDAKLNSDEHNSLCKSSGEILELFEMKINKTQGISDEYKNIINIATSVSTPIDHYSNVVHTMSTLKKYYDFTMRTRCGIPYIDIVGKADDWKSLYTIIDFIEKYIDKYLKIKWSTYLRGTIMKIIEHLEGKEDLKFMQDIYKMDNKRGSGAPFYVMGWIHNFIPPLDISEKFLYDISDTLTYQKGENNKKRCKRGPSDGYNGYQQMPYSISNCPVVWDYFGDCFDYTFTTSLTSFSVSYSEDQKCPCIIPQNRLTMRNDTLFGSKNNNNNDNNSDIFSVIVNNSDTPSCHHQ